MVSALVIAALFGFTVLIGQIGSAVSARHRAQSTADLAALAGAYRALDGQDPACAAAKSLAEQSSGRLDSCELDDLDVIVTVEVDAAGVGFSFGPARAQARAGPAPGR